MDERDQRDMSIVLLLLNDESCIFKQSIDVGFKLSSLFSQQFKAGSNES